VGDWLVWGRNYGEIASYKRVTDAGRKWLVAIPEGVTITASGMEPGMIERRIVPDELVLTSREALAFGMGLAVAGSRPDSRRVVAEREWGWGE
jgi:hypothetical protein